MSPYDPFRPKLAGDPPGLEKKTPRQIEKALYEQALIAKLKASRPGRHKEPPTPATNQSREP